MLATGSPPPMRGTHGSRLNKSPTFRITPAHAGNTIFVYFNCRFPQDHPRPCGEHSAVKTPSHGIPGSPPPMRGTLSSLSGCKLIIGSPPPMRGTPEIRSDKREILGITPAHAGNTRNYRLMSRRFEDHPRPCGEHKLNL